MPRRAGTTWAAPAIDRRRVEAEPADVLALPGHPVSGPSGWRDPHLDADESLVDLRCSVLVAREDRVLLIRRGEGSATDWVLPGGRPRPGEGLGSCARREAYEETGLRVHPHRIGLVGEVIGRGRERIVEVIFVGLLDSHDGEPHAGEAGTTPTWLPVADLAAVNLRPPIAGYLPNVMQGRFYTAAYVGNLWRPPAADAATDAADATGDHEIIWPS